MTKKNIAGIINSDFFKNVLTLMSGTAIAQIITIATIPLLSRLFTPDEFGTLAIFISLSSLLSSMSGGRYELAIMLPKKNINAYHLLIVSMWFIIGISLISFFILFIFFNPISELLDFKSYRYFVFLIPISVFFQATYETFSNWFSRFKDFKNISYSKITKSSLSISSKTLFGFLHFNSFGLIIGEFFGSFFSTIFLILRNKKKHSFKEYKIEKRNLKKMMKEYRNFPFFSMPMAFLNSISVNILVYVLSIGFNSTIVGFYSQANKVINYPLSFITSSFSSVYYQKLTTTKNKKKLYLFSYFLSFIIALLIVSPLIFWGEELFSFVLGEKWRYSGKIAKIIIPIAVASFATRNVSSVFSLLKLQQITLIWQIIYLIIVISIFYLFNELKLEKILIFFSFSGAIMYIFLALIGYIFLTKSK